MKKAPIALTVAFCFACLVMLGGESLWGNGTGDMQQHRLKLPRKAVKALLPDLTVSIRRSPTVAYAGNKLPYIDVLVRNIGKGVKKSSACFNVWLFLSKDTKISHANIPLSQQFREDVALGAGKGYCPAMNPGASWRIRDFSGANGNHPMKIPDDTPPGEYFLGTVVDVEEWIPESNEGNNIRFAPIRIGIKKTAKIPVILLPDIVPTSLYFDGFCNLKAKITNQGKVKLKRMVHFALYRNGQPVSSSGVDLSIPPGGDMTIQVESKAIIGTWAKEIAEWKLVMDHKNEVPESSETNNSITAEMRCRKGKALRDSIPR